MKPGFALGVCDFWDRYKNIYEELNVQWAKFPVGYPATVEEGLETVAPALAQGIEPILDLRTYKDFIGKGIISNCPNCQLEYRLAKEWPACPQCKTPFIVIPKQAREEMIRNQDIEFIGWVTHHMQGLFPKVKIFEIWGEPQCPLLTSGCLPPVRLANWLQCLQKAKPEGAWLVNGGLGIGPWKDTELVQLMQVGTMQWCDALNLHPFSFQESPPVQKKFFDWMLVLAQYLLKKHGRPDLPIMVSEWGYPSGVGAWEGSLLASSVMPIGIEAIPESRQAQMLNVCLDIFARYDVGPVCLMTRDLEGAGVPQANPSFWGFHCGIIRSDETQKPSYKVVKAWGQRVKDKGKKGKPKR